MLGRILAFSARFDFACYKGDRSSGKGVGNDKNKRKKPQEQFMVGAYMLAGSDAGVPSYEGGSCRMAGDRPVWRD
jgi:hypothetical protein